MSEAGEPTQVEYGFMVVLTCPTHMSRADVERDLKNSIEFGSPFISLVYKVRKDRAIEDVTMATDAGERL